MLRLQHKSYRTERSYLSWVRHFLVFVGNVAEKEISEVHLKRYLTHLAVDRQVASATQEQAFNALLFLYRHVLNVEIVGLRETIRSRRPKRLPVVLTRAEVNLILNALSGQYRLMAELIYGAGLRLRECLSLRVQDVEFESDRMIIRAGKGNKDRVAVLPQKPREALARHSRSVRVRYDQDRESSNPGVPLPYGSPASENGLPSILCDTVLPPT